MQLHPNTKTAWKIVIGTLFIVGVVVVALNSVVATPQQDDRVVFTRFDGVDFELFVVNTDGSNEHQLTYNDANDWAATWSPDKSMIAFRSDRDGISRIFLMDADGSNVRALTPPGVSVGGPEFTNSISFSPTGSQIAFEAYIDDNWDIYIMPVNPLSGREMWRVTSDPAMDNGPAWSPDGAYIAFHSLRDGYFDIYVASLCHGSISRLTYNPATMDVFPVWSPDGSQIAFHSERDGDSEIYIMNADGSNQHALTNNYDLDRAPRFNDDGTQILFRSERSGESNIYAMNVDGSNQHQITNNTFRDMHPDW